MKPIKINLHSFIDVITNSSTEIYVQCKSKSKENMFSLINHFLKIAESDKKAEDLFDITTDNDSLIVIPKDDSQEAVNMSDRIYSLFNIEAEYDG